MIPVLPDHVAQGLRDDGSVYDLASESAVALLTENVKVLPGYYAVTETIHTDKTYVLPWEGRALELYCDKAVSVRLQSGGDAIQLPANIGINVRHLSVSEIILEGVPANTLVRLIVLGG